MIKNEVKFGAIFSYILIILNSLYGIILTPYIVGHLGTAEYGVYKTISSFTAAFVVLDLGLGSTMIRYIAKFRSEKKDSEIPNYIAMCFVQAMVLVVVAFIVLSIGYTMIESIYAQGLTATEIIQAKKLYAVFGLWICIHIFGNVITGIVNGYNKFSFTNGIKIFSLILRVVLTLVFLPIVNNSLILPWINIIISLLVIIIELSYSYIKIGVKIKYTHWENSLFKESFKYTILMFVTSIVAQVNNSLGNVIVGALLSSSAVTVYSIGLLFFSMYEHLSTSISGVMLPTVIDTMQNDDSQFTRIKSLVINVGRIQFALLAAVLIGFIILGKEFLLLWMGKGFDDAYYITIILMVPSLFELCVNVCLSILRAKNILGFRTLIIALSTLLNLIIAFFGTKYFGYYATAIGTGVSFFLGSVVVMGMYYYKKLSINILNIYSGIFKRIWICLILSGVACYFAKIFMPSVLLKVVFGILAFVIVYAVTLLLFGLSEKEKELLKLNKFIKGVKKNG